MAKRKRLSPANPVFMREDTVLPADRDRPVAPPIADVAGEASARAALDELSQTLHTARSEGRMIIELSLDEVDRSYLVRDRIGVQDDDMAALMDSLRQRGQQTPIEVAPLQDGRYGLISGWRRCAALSALAETYGAADFGTVLALVRQPDQSSDAYLAMVEENEIRVGLSFYERARIVTQCVKNSVYSSETEALRALFSAASRAKRSKIKSFISIVEALDGSLRFPQAIGERLGLQLSKALEQNSGLADQLRHTLRKGAPESAEAEQKIIQASLAPAKQSLTKPKTTLVREDLAPGVQLRSGPQEVHLSGAGLTPELQARLIAWLREQTS